MQNVKEETHMRKYFLSLLDFALGRVDYMSSIYLYFAVTCTTVSIQSYTRRGTRVPSNTVHAPEPSRWMPVSSQFHNGQYVISTLIFPGSAIGLNSMVL